MPYNNLRNEDDYLIYIGRLATGSGIIGMLIALTISLIYSWPTLGAVAFMLFGGYVGTTGFWGAHQSKKWFRKYKYKMNSIIWHIVRVLVIIIGFFLGLIVWGIIEHLLLIIAMEETVGDDHFSSLIITLALLIPYLGPHLEEAINYSPRVQNDSAYKK